ncbi:MAG: phosphoribosylformylglycinamidine synthase subunit PurQ [bacterium]
MKFGVLVFPGSNCDMDCYHVIKDVIKEDVSYIWHQDTNLSKYDCIILPGGFSYGDYLRTGAVARFSKAMSKLVEFAESRKPVIGICNGFQILLETGLLPGAMLKNKTLKFICKYVNLRVENNSTLFTKKYKKNEVIKIPIAHGEGNYYIERSGLNELIKNKQIVFKYSDEDGRITNESNPNGSLENIAGIVNKKGNVLGMMPHPERCSEQVLGSSDGLLIFQSIKKWLKKI